MKKLIPLFILLFILTGFTGCKNKETDAITAYTDEMKTFYENIETTSTSMNGIDISDPNMRAVMLSYLDDMNGYFTHIKSIEIPEEYSDTSSNITNAYSYMNQANALYHQALEGEVVDTDLLNTAKSYYDNAMECARNIGSILANNTENE